MARLRAVLEHHGGVRSSEHHRVHAQGFLGDGDRLDGLRTALHMDPENARARCDLARALSARGKAAETTAVLGDGDPEACSLENDSWGFTWGDRDDVLDWQERRNGS